jgi:thiol:disulfide interchange protein
MKTSVKFSLGMAVTLALFSAAAWRIHRRHAATFVVQADAKDLISWRYNLEAARQEAAAAGKPLFIEFQASWCPDCHALKAQSWTNSSVASALASYIPVSIDIDANPAIAKQYGVDAIPSLFVVDSKTGEIRKQIRNEVLGPEALLNWLD